MQPPSSQRPVSPETYVSLRAKSAAMVEMQLHLRTPHYITLPGKGTFPNAGVGGQLVVWKQPVDWVTLTGCRKIAHKVTQGQQVSPTEYVLVDSAANDMEANDATTAGYAMTAFLLPGQPCRIVVMFHLPATGLSRPLQQFIELLQSPAYAHVIEQALDKYAQANKQQP